MGLGEDARDTKAEGNREREETGGAGEERQTTNQLCWKNARIKLNSLYANNNL